MVKHLYQRTITHNGKKVKAWYFWFLDKNGKRIRRTCGKNGKPCLTKKEAQSFIELLDDNELLKENITFNQFAINFFTESSFYIKKQRLKGYEYEVYSKAHSNNASLRINISENFSVDMEITFNGNFLDQVVRYVQAMPIKESI